MSEKTNIAWADSSLNWWEGCTKVSAGCQHCYAEARDKRFTGGKLWGKGAPRRKSMSAVKSALAMNRKPWICEQTGIAFNEMEKARLVAHDDGVTWHRRRIFSLSLGDWLDGEVPVEWLAEMLDTIRQCDQVTWILCTKRPENWRDRIKGAFAVLENKSTDCRVWLQQWLNGNPPSNVILLTSVENQEMADERIPELLRIPAACRGLSLEPLLGPVDLLRPYCHACKNSGRSDSMRGAAHCPECDGGNPFEGGTIHWLIIGCESGPARRDCKLEWVLSLVKQGRAAGVAMFVKQLQDSEGMVGKDVSEFPKDLRVQNWPKGF